MKTDFRQIMRQKNLLPLWTLWLVLGIGVFNSTARAGDATWTGAGSDGLWTTATNWGSDLVTGSAGGTSSADTATFSSGTGGVQMVTVDNGRNLKNITFDGNADSYTLTGGTLNLTGNGTLQLTGTVSGVTPANSVFTIAAPLVLMGSYTINDSRGFTNTTQGAAINVTGPIIYGGAGAGTLTLNAGYMGSSKYSGTTTLAGSITDGTAGGRLGLAVSANGNGVPSPYVWLTGSNSYTGGTVIGTGGVGFSSLNSLGNFNTTGTVSLGVSSGAGSEIQYTGTGGVLAGTLALGYTGGVAGLTETVDQSGSGLLNLTHDLLVQGNASRVFVLQGSTSGTGQFSGIIANGTSTAVVSLTKAGTGTWLLTNSNSYSGGTTLSSGTLILGNASAAGTGTLNLNGGVLLANTDLSGGNALANPVAFGASGTMCGANNLQFAGAFTQTGGSRTLTNGLTSGTLTLSGPVYLSNTNTAGYTLTLAGSGNTLISGGISNYNGTGTAGGLTITNTETTTLSGSNSYVGATTVSAGVLNLQNNSALGTGTATVTSGAALQLQSGIAVNNVLNLAGSGINNYGALQSLSGSNTYSGPINLTGAIRINADAGSLYLTSGSIALGANTVTLGGGGNIVINSILSGSGGGLTKDGGGNVTLTASNSYTGLTKISSGTLSIGDGTAGNDGSIASSSSINLENAFSSLVYNLSSTATRTYSNLIFGSGSLTVSGSGTLTLAGTNTYTGPTLVTSSGALIFASNSSLGSSPISDRSIAGGITLPLTGGTATIPGITGTSTGNFTPIFLNSGSISTLVLNPGAGISNSSSAIINDGLAPMGLTKNGAGTQILTGANSYTGPTTISSGTLSVSILANGGSNSGIGASSSGSANLLFNGGTLQYTGGTVTFNRDAESLVTNSGIDVSNSNTNLIWSGAFINGTGHYISKYGLGTLTLSGSVSNSALSGMAVHSGTLVLAKSSGSVFGNLDVDAGATAVITGIASSQIGNHYFGVINGTWT